MSSCTACGQALRSEARFCTSCGQAVVAQPLVATANAQANAAEQATHSSTREPALTAAPEASAAQTQRPPVAARPSAPATSNGAGSTAGMAEVVNGTGEVSNGAAAPSENGATPAHPVPPATPENRYPTPGSTAPRQYDAAAISAAAAQAREQFGATVQRVPLPQEQITRAIRDGVLVAGGAWVLFALLVGLVDVFSEGNAAPMMWLRASALVLAGTVGSAVTISGSISGTVGDDLLSLFSLAGASSLGFDSAASMSMSFMPLGFTVILMVVVFFVARKAASSSQTADVRSRIIRALIMGAAFAVTATVLTMALQFHEGAMTLGASPVSVFLRALLLISLGAFVGLGAAGSRIASLPQAWANDARTGAEVVVGFFVVAALATLIPVVYALTQANGNSGLPIRFSILEGISTAAALSVLLLAYLPTLFVLLGGVIMGVTVTVDVVGTGVAASADNVQRQRWGILEGGVPGVILLGMLVGGLIVAVVVGVRATLRRPVEANQLRLWQPAVIAGGLWLVLTWLTAISMKVDGSVEGSASFSGLGSLLGGTSAGGSAGFVGTIGLSLAGVALAGAVWTLIAVGAGRTITLSVGRALPRVLAVLGGRGMHESWQVAVADSMMRRAQQPPKRLSGVAEGLRSGTIAPPTTPVI